MAVKTYNPSKVIITFKGKTIQGYADGTFVSVTPSSEWWTKSTGADGEVSRSATNDYTHEVEFTLKQTSSSNDYLSQEAMKDKRLGTGKGELQIKDTGGTTIFFWPEAWIRQPADNENAKETSERSWTLDTGQVKEMNIGGNG